MVKRIRKRAKKGPHAIQCVPMVMAMTCLYGLRLEGKDFRQPFDSAGKIRMVLQSHLGWDLLIPDRILSRSEYLDWGLKASPGKLAQMFMPEKLIPMGPSLGNDDTEDQPLLGLLPFLAVVRGKGLEMFLRKRPEDFSELNRVVFQNSISSFFNLIPGYDQLLYSPPCHIRNINASINGLNEQMNDAFQKASIPPPMEWGGIPEGILDGIPLYEPLVK